MRRGLGAGEGGWGGRGAGDSCLFREVNLENRSVSKINTNDYTSIAVIIHAYVQESQHTHTPVSYTHLTLPTRR